LHRAGHRMPRFDFHAIPQAFKNDKVHAYEFVASAHLAGQQIPTHVSMLPVDKRHAVPGVFVSLESSYNEEIVISMKMYSPDTPSISICVNHYCENTYEKNHLEVFELGGHENKLWEFSGKIGGNDYSNGCLTDSKWLVSALGDPVFTIRIDPVFNIRKVSSSNDIISAVMSAANDDEKGAKKKRAVVLSS